MIYKILWSIATLLKPKLDPQECEYFYCSFQIKGTGSNTLPVCQLYFNKVTLNCFDSPYKGILNGKYRYLTFFSFLLFFLSLQLIIYQNKIFSLDPHGILISSLNYLLIFLVLVPRLLLLQHTTSSLFYSTSAKK